MADNIAPASPRNSRFAGIQSNVRSFLREMPTPSSLYSRSPNPNQKDGDTSRTIPSFRGFLSRNRPGVRPSANSSASNLPLNPQRTGTTTFSPAPQPSEWGRHPADPAPAILSDRHPTDQGPALFDHPDIEEQAREAHRKKHKKRRRRRHHTAWVRPHRGPKRKQGGVCVPIFHGHTRVKALSCIISGLFLTTVLTIYLTIALAVKGISQEIHILFILTILGTTVFFVHSLIRLCVMVLRPHSSRSRNHIPSVVGPEGFNPNAPIRVHLARDEEIAAQMEDGTIEEGKLESLKAPPPAYGLWRCSVRVNPDLLHWQRVEMPADSQSGGSMAGSPTESHATGHGQQAQQPTARTQQRQAPRPPSYASDDGVEYVVSAQPRNTVYFPAPTSEIHPAYRDCILPRPSV